MHVMPPELFVSFMLTEAIVVTTTKTCHPKIELAATAFVLRSMHSNVKVFLMHATPMTWMRTYETLCFSCQTLILQQDPHATFSFKK